MVARTVATDIVGAPAPAAPAFAAQEKRIQRMEAYFQNQKRVPIRIRKEMGEQWVQINGYAFRIQAGVDLEVPKDVANLLREADVI